MGHPIKNPELDRQVRERHAAGASLSAIARDCGIGVNRVRRILGRPLPPSQTPEGQRAKRESKEERTMKNEITIRLSDAAMERLERVADTTYLPPDVFVTALVASYLSGPEPLSITLAPTDPDVEEPAEDEGDEGDEEPADEGAPEEEFVFREEDFEWLKPGVDFVVRDSDKGEIAVGCLAIRFFDAEGKSVLAKDGRIHSAGDQIVCVSKDGAFEGNKMFFPEEVVFRGEDEEDAE